MAVPAVLVVDVTVAQVVAVVAVAVADVMTAHCPRPVTHMGPLPSVGRPVQALMGPLPSHPPLMALARAP